MIYLGFPSFMSSPWLLARQYGTKDALWERTPTLLTAELGETMRVRRPSFVDPIEVFTAEQRPDLWERSRSLFETVWPEYNMHGNHTWKCFSALYPKHAHLQVLLYDASQDSIAGGGRTIPFRWDGTLEDLPAGMDALGRPRDR
jgi:hypothetical protein